MLLYCEVLSLKLVCGFALIFGAILISEMLPLKSKDADVVDQAAFETETILDDALAQME